MVKLRHGRLYRLSGMKSSMWQVPHPSYGRPVSVVGRYIGTMKGTRRWYGFEIHVGGRERGVIFMPEVDLAQLKVEEVGPGR